MSVATDPFSMVEEALWWALDSHPSISAIVRPANRVRFTSVTEPRQVDNPAASDLPELTIYSQTTQANTHNTSSGFGLVKRYGVGIVTGENRITGEASRRAGLHQVHFAVQQALWRFRTGFPDLPFTAKCEVVDSSDVMAPSDPKTRAPGWQCACNVDVWINLSDIDVEELR